MFNTVKIWGSLDPMQVVFLKLRCNALGVVLLCRNTDTVLSLIVKAINKKDLLTFSFSSFV